MWGVATDGARSCADGGWGGRGVPLLGVGVWVCELGGRAEVAVAVGGGSPLTRGGGAAAGGVCWGGMGWS